MPDTYDTFPPSCLDRADGTPGFFGTVTPADVIAQRIATAFNGNSQAFFEEDPHSPKIDFGEQTTIQHTFWCDCGPPPATPGMGFDGPDGGTLYELIPFIQRGQIQTASDGAVTRILNSTVERFPPNIAKVTVTSEGLSFGIPPDEFSIEPQEINPDLMKHPRYNYGQDGNTSTGYGLTQQQKIIIRQALQSQSMYQTIGQLNQIFAAAGVQPGTAGPINWTLPQQKMAWEIIQKNYRGEDTWYVPALTVTWAQYIFPLPGEILPSLNPGGYIEDPTNAMDFSIPYYLWSIDGTDSNPSDGSNDILQSLAKVIFDLYDDGVTYLRKADRLDFSRTWYKYTRTWVGAPTGPADQDGNNYVYWDPDIYPTWNAAAQEFETTALGPLPS